MKKNLYAAFKQSKEGAEAPFCACSTIAGYVTVSGRKCQVTVTVEADEDEWLDDAASIKPNAQPGVLPPAAPAGREQRVVGGP